MKNKIGWCSMTWNPVIGCKNNCEYCYARKINQRFKFTEDFNIPEWRGKSFNKKLPKKPQRIFVGSMSEIAHWKKEWVEMVIEKIKQYPQHTFQFLTKHQETYSNYYGWPKNCILGVTVTKADDYWKGKHNWVFFSSKNIRTFFSFEPLLSPIPITELLEHSNIDWVIIGAETGNRKGKVIPNLEWVLEIVRYCEHNKIPVYIKDNLTKYYAECRGYKHFPVSGI